MLCKAKSRREGIGIKISGIIFYDGVGEGGVKKVQNLVHVVCEWPLLQISSYPVLVFRVFGTLLLTTSIAIFIFLQTNAWQSNLYFI